MELQRHIIQQQIQGFTQEEEVHFPVLYYWKQRGIYLFSDDESIQTD